MQLQQRINAFQQLGTFFGEVARSTEGRFSELFELAKAHNGWFSEENIRFALESWSNALSQENLEQWLSPYALSEEKEIKTIAVVMAGNVPLVGFHDFLSILISGNKVLARLSSNDKILFPFVTEELIRIAPDFEDYILFTEEKLQNFDAVIATGSNNTARYFDYYFGKYPNIIRKNRNSVAVLDGTENEEQLEALAHDVFRYFGLGCRNVSKIFIPNQYDFDPFFNAMFSWKSVINDTKYMNNYDYNKAVYLMSNIALLDNEFLLLKEDSGFSSPISVVFFERYKDLESLKGRLSENEEDIQCVVSGSVISGSIPFGQSQMPELWDYADGVDTINFLVEL